MRKDRNLKDCNIVKSRIVVESGESCDGKHVDDLLCTFNRKERHSASRNFQLAWQLTVVSIYDYQCIDVIQYFCLLVNAACDRNNKSLVIDETTTKVCLWRMMII